MDQVEFDSVLPAAQAGAEWAWERIYNDLAGSVRAYVRRRGAAEPDDVVGEVFLHLARGIKDFDGTEANFRTWVFTVAHRRMLDDRRRLSRHPVDPVADAPEPAPSSPDATADEAFQSIDTDRVQRLIAQLVPDQRDVMLLRIVGGLTIAEVAEAVGKSVGATKALQRRALAALTKILQTEGVPLEGDAALTSEEEGTA